MDLKDLNNYMHIRYDRWFEYSRYRCNETGMKGHEGDILNYVLLDILEKKQKKALELLQQKVKRRKKSGAETDEEITKLDTYIMKAITYSCIYPTSSYRLKYEDLPADRNICPASLKLIDTEYDVEMLDRATDKKENERMLIITILNSLMLSDKAKTIFRFVFDGNPLTEWPGDESSSKLRRTYKAVSKMIVEATDRNKKNLFNSIVL